MRVKKFLIDRVHPRALSPSPALAGEGRGEGAKSSFPDGRAPSTAPSTLRTDFLSMAAISRVPHNLDAMIVARVLEATARATGYTANIIAARRRTEPLVTIRFIAMLVCHERGLNLSEIARRFSLDPGTVRHAVTTAKHRIESEPECVKYKTLIESFLDEPATTTCPHCGRVFKQASTETINPKGE